MAAILLAALLALAANPPSAAAQKNSQVIAGLVKDSGEDMEKLNRIILEHERLLQKYPESDFTPTVLLQLAQLYQRHSAALFQQQMEQYEQDLQAFERNEILEEPELPHANMEKTITLLERLVENYPKITFRDKALYMLSMAYLEQGNRVRAQLCLERIISEFPRSVITLESHFRIAEFYFDRREYSPAIEHYKALLEKWDNPYFDMALYKLGWSYYSLGDYPHAITSFVYLLEDMALIERTDSQQLSRSKADLSSEAIQYIASCYAEYGGPSAAQSFFASRTDKSYTLPILVQLVNLYQKRAYYPEAIAAQEILLTLYPFYENAPELLQQMVDNYEADGRKPQAIQTRERIVQQFAPGGFWLIQHASGPVHDKADSLARVTLRSLGLYYQAESQRSNRLRDYQIAIDKYEDYLAKYSQAPDAAEIRYFLAECHYAKGDFPAAITAYTAVLTEYDTTRYRHDAAYNRVLCHYQLLGSDKGGDSSLVAIPDFIGSGDTLRLTVSRLSESGLLLAANEFICLFPASKNHDQVLMKLGETLHEMQQYGAAAQVYKHLVDLGPDRPYYLSAALNAGQCYFDDNRFEEADRWFTALQQQFPDSAHYRDRVNRLGTLAKFKIAEGLAGAGQAEASAQLMQMVAERATEAPLRDRALFEAAAQYQKLNRNPEAARALEQLAQQQPPSELADEALYRAAILREGEGDWTLASQDYLLLCDTWPQSAYAQRSLKSAALCQENLRNWGEAGRLYSRFALTYPDSLTDLIESLTKAGEMAHKIGDLTGARRNFTQAVQSWRQNGEAAADIDPYYVAQAQFMLGELLFGEYAQITLTPPFERSMKRKVAKFNEVFEAYKSTLEYQIADWSTAASFRIGSSFEEFVRAFMDSPPPRGLKGDGLQEYQAKLTEAAKPYKERALETYAKMVEQAKANAIENEWVSQSRERLQALRTELGVPPEEESARETAPLEANPPAPDADGGAHPAPNEGATPS
jgi:tetratricopeptide (TPR) repeat protein